jgi:hypothetical protein
MFAQLQQPAPDPRSVNGNLPAACADAILTALEKKPAQRFATAGEFVAAMRGN